MKFCWHDWGKWSAPMDTSNGYEKVQSRYCVKCNKAEVAKIKQPWNIWFLVDKIKDAE
jgi:hypothetical protein